MEIPDDLVELTPEEFAFAEFHAMQLAANGIKISKDVVRQLYNKLTHHTFDVGNYVQLMEHPNEKCFRVVATQDIEAHKDVFLVDHCFSFRYRDLRKTLLDNEPLRHRLRNMTKFFKERQTLRDQLFRPVKAEEANLNPEFDGDETLTDPRTVDVDWENIETISFCSTGISDPDIVADMLTKCPKLKGLWLNGSPVSEGARMALMHMYLEEKHPNVQIYNSKFTKHAKEWAVKFATWGMMSKISDEITIEDMRICDISGRNFYALKDDHTIFDRMQSVRTLKAQETFFDSFGEANRFIEMIRDMKNLERIEMDYYMLDMFWDIKDRIRKLNPTIKYINNYDLGYDKPKPVDEEVDFIIENLWKITHSYKLAHGENVDSEPIYYVLDEVGSALGHEEDPNCVTFPFIFFKHNKPGTEAITYNLIFPIKDIKADEFLNVNFVRGCPEELKGYRLAVWTKGDPQFYIDKFKEYEKTLSERLEGGQKVIEKMLLDLKSEKKQPSYLSGKSIKVFTDCERVKKHLTDNRFDLVEDLEHADLFFLVQNIKHVKDQLGDKYPLLNSESSQRRS